ncbi:cold-shock protein [Ulvibacter antarcticus]|uniref:Putative cold-shock DNA-binding protein n=1 Tax=Ulvibacter antarcticus TaxID=442714 RepID=A0A3L9ZCP5_9FLAO|nr:cold shock domain-containing protein [Ulvibacter antarcticus]RMA64422.1 putative cold-shock DNA-binding protein [Ulvibacter antarcticus]
MAGSQETYGKKEREKKKLKKQEEKRKKAAERKLNSKGGGLENMLVYVDEYGRFTDTPPDPSQKVKVDAEDIVIGIPKKEDEEPVDPIHKGKVDFFDSSKGFGFIIDELDSERYFVHVSGTTEDIAEGDKVSFELERGMKGLNAVRVKKI